MHRHRPEQHLAKKLAPQVVVSGQALLQALQVRESDFHLERVAALKAKLVGLPGVDAKNLVALADFLGAPSVWLVGGDGWAYDTTVASTTS